MPDLNVNVKFSELHIHLHVHQDDSGLVEKVENLAEKVQTVSSDLEAEVPKTTNK